MLHLTFNHKYILGNLLLAEKTKTNQAFRY